MTTTTPWPPTSILAPNPLQGLGQCPLTQVSSLQLPIPSSSHRSARLSRPSRPDQGASSEDSVATLSTITTSNDKAQPGHPIGSWLLPISTLHRDQLRSIFATTSLLCLASDLADDTDPPVSSNDGGGLKKPSLVSVRGHVDNLAIGDAGCGSCAWP
ncbi:hypothetical protein BGX29_010087 [Mortierella sp. GBA35]|nr:hypothetical protein BGX29_010087 [Mortierella sp. GBA35]